MKSTMERLSQLSSPATPLPVVYPSFQDMKQQSGSPLQVSYAICELENRDKQTIYLESPKKGIVSNYFLLMSSPGLNMKFLFDLVTHSNHVT